MPLYVQVNELIGYHCIGVTDTFLKSFIDRLFKS